MEFVGADHWSFQKRLAAHVLDAADERRRRPPRPRPRTSDQRSSRRSHSTSRSRRVGEREGTKKKQTFCSAFGEVVRVERLQRVEDDHRREHAGQPDGGADGTWDGGPGRRVLSRTRTPASEDTLSGSESSPPAGEWPGPRRRSPGRAGPGGWRCRRRRAAGCGTGARRRSPAAAGSASGGRAKARAPTDDGRRRSQRRRAGPRRGAGRRSGGVCHWSPRIRTGKRTIAASIATERGRPGGQQDRGGGSRGGDQDAGAGEEVAQGTALAEACTRLLADGAVRVQLDRHPRRHQRPVLAEQLHPQLVAAAGWSDAAVALAAVPVVGVEACSA